MLQNPVDCCTWEAGQTDHRMFKPQIKSANRIGSKIRHYQFIERFEDTGSK
jgi:hypothetical protein